MAEPNPQRKGSTVEERKRYYERERERAAAAEKRKELFDALNHLCRSNDRGWLTSVAGDASLRIECRPDSELPDLLVDRGFDLQSLGTSTRIEGGKFLPVCVYALHLPPLR